jgi:hypothetical protein
VGSVSENAGEDGEGGAASAVVVSVGATSLADAGPGVGEACGGAVTAAADDDGGLGAADGAVALLA